MNSLQTESMGASASAPLLPTQPRPRTVPKELSQPKKAQISSPAPARAVGTASPAQRLRKPVNSSPKSPGPSSSPLTAQTHDDNKY